MTAIPLEWQSVHEAGVGLLSNPMVGDALIKLTVENMIVDKRSSALMCVCAYHEMPWVGELCEQVTELSRSLKQMFSPYPQNRRLCVYLQLFTARLGL